MPSIQDLVELSEELGSRPVLILANRCAAVRNRNSKCRRCVEICPVEDAIAIESNELVIDFDACRACGACTTICPTNALTSLDPPDLDLASQAADAVLELGLGQAVIACARATAQHTADPRKYAEVPCLCRVEESLLVGLISRGVTDVLLVDANCSTCIFKKTEKLTNAVVDYTNDLLERWGSEAFVERASEFPEECALTNDRGLLGTSRRQFFSRARGGAKDAALKTALKSLHLEKDAPTLREMLQVGTGRMPQFEPHRHHAVLDALDRIGDVPTTGAEPSRLWGRVEIDATVCNACGMCPVFCPTGALSRVADDEAHEEGADLILEFSASECVQCDLCVVSCFRKCLTLEHVADPQELYDFEPRRIMLSSKPSSSIIGNISPFK